MPRLTGDRVPKYRQHKHSGQAVVSIDGHDVYLGPWNTRASKLEYDRVIGEWLANGRALPAATQLTVVEVCARYMKWAAGYYVKNGEPTGTTEGLKVALRVLCQHYGRTPAAAFGPLALVALQSTMVELDMSRRYINDNIDRIRRLFKWAVAQELVPVTVHQALTTVAGLRRGRTAARENDPVLPVPDDVVEATIHYLWPIVATWFACNDSQALDRMRSAHSARATSIDQPTSGPIARSRTRLNTTVANASSSSARGLRRSSRLSSSGPRSRIASFRPSQKSSATPRSERVDKAR